MREPAQPSTTASSSGRATCHPSSRRVSEAQNEASGGREVRPPVASHSLLLVKRPVGGGVAKVAEPAKLVHRRAPHLALERPQCSEITGLSCQPDGPDNLYKTDAKKRQTTGTDSFDDPGDLVFAVRRMVYVSIRTMAVVRSLANPRADLAT